MALPLLHVHAAERSPPIQSPWSRMGILPTSIVIEDGIMVVTTPKQRVVKSVSDVAKVLDLGHLYQILFIASEKTQLFVCQKDLLVAGTIEGFERLFENVIVKPVEKS